MKTEQPENKRFLQILQEKIYDLESGYEIDNDNLKPINTIQNNNEIGEELEIKNETENSGNPKLSNPLRANRKIKLKESENNLLEYQNQNIDEEESSDIITTNNKRIIPLNNDYIKNYTSIKSVLCKNHGKLFLKINPTNYEIVCEKCIEEGKISQLEIDNSNNNNETELLTFNCVKHPNEKGSFYCDDCKQFVCKRCFADVHREHKCHLPKVIRNEFFNYLNESIDKTNNLIPILNDSVNNVQNIYNNLKAQKDEIMKIPQNSLKAISSNNDIQIDLLEKKTNEQLMGIDHDIHDDYFTFNGIKSKNQKFLEILKKMSNDISNKENNFELCGYHRKNIDIINEIQNFIKTSFNFINVRLNNTNLKYMDNKEKIENSLNLMNKEISNYENSCISSISTGRKNRGILLLRFIRFVHKEIKYFKNSLIGFASNENIFLTGLVLCGLHIKRKKRNNNDDNNIIYKEDLSDNNNSQNNNDNNIIDKEDASNDNHNNDNININEADENAKLKIKMPIQIYVYTMVHQAEGDLLYTQKCELNGVKSDDEPCVIIHFEKGIKITKEKVYLIKVENLSENNYSDLWTGNVGKDDINKNLQVIRCNNSGIQFLFKKTNGLQTDFDEFEQGIIDGIIYSIDK